MILGSTPDTAWVTADSAVIHSGVHDRLKQPVHLCHRRSAHPRVEQLLTPAPHVRFPDIRKAHVRRWRKQLLDAGVSAASVAKVYRLLKAIMNTAVDDGAIRRNPCRIRGAAQDHSPERTVLTLRQVGQLADAIHPR